MAKDTAILLWKANRKPYPSFQMAPLYSTNSNLCMIYPMVRFCSDLE